MNKPYQDIFTKIFETNFWNGNESKSGEGSDYKNTVHIIRELPLIFEKYNIKSILDIPCGDFNWFQHINLKDISYIGGDIVKNVVDINNAKFQSDARKFYHLDLIESKLPTVDLILCRDCLFHLPNQKIKKSINNIVSSNSKYLLTTTHNWRGVESNNDINFGEWRRLNLQESPFNFSNPVDMIFEGSTRKTDADRFLGLWKISELPTFAI